MEMALLEEGLVVSTVLGRQGGCLVLPTAARVQYAVSINGLLQCFVMKQSLIEDGHSLRASKYISAIYKNDKYFCAHRIGTYMFPRAQLCYPGIKLRTAVLMWRDKC